MGFPKIVGLGITGILAPLYLAFMLFNIFGAIVAGVWLATKGQWTEIGVGIGFVYLLPRAWAWSCIPTEMLALRAGALHDRGQKLLPLILGFFALTWGYCACAAWTLVVFVFFANRIDPGTTIPMLIWAYGSLMTPLGYMASKDPADNIASHLAVLFSMVAFAALVVLYLFEAQAWTTVLWLLALVGIAALLNTALMSVMMFQERAAKRRAEGLYVDMDTGRETDEEFSFDADDLDQP